MLSTKFSQGIYRQKYGSTTIAEKSKALANRVLPTDVERVLFQSFMNAGLLMPGGRFLYTATREKFNAANCFAFGVEDSKEGWADTLKLVTLGSMMGGGCGIDGSSIRAKGSPLSSGGHAAGPLSFFRIVNELGKYIEQGGSRRVALMFLLHCLHPDIQEFMDAKRGGDLTNANLSVIFNTQEEVESSVFEQVILSSLEFGDPSPSLNVLDVGVKQTLRNACGEVISHDNGSPCVLGAINLAKFIHYKPQDIIEVAYVLALFLLHSIDKIEAPTKGIKDLMLQEHRIGVEITGLYEFLMYTNRRYEPTVKLDNFLTSMNVGIARAVEDFERSTGYSSIAQQAFGPTGSLSILLETSSGIEPLYSPAYIRRTRGREDEITEHIIIDPVAERLHKEGIQVVDTAVDLGNSVEGIKKKFDMLLFLQGFCDQGISTTVNTKEYSLWSSKEKREIVHMARRYAPWLRGFTFYPNGGRDSQPLQPISIEEAIERKGVVQSSDVCELNGRNECS
jgi:ribonucleoside-diphosphate reductase alpha chain